MSGILEQEVLYLFLCLKQAVDPGKILFHVMDELGNPCYDIGMEKHRLGKRIFIKDVEEQEVAYINCYGFSKMLRCSIFIKGSERLSILCSFVSSEPLFKINGQTWVFRGEVLLRNFDVVDVDRTVIFSHGKQWTPAVGDVYGIQIQQTTFLMESLCIAAVIDSFATGGQKAAAAIKIH